jgi:hypothetical protein
MGILRSITINKVLIREIEKILVEAEVEGSLVEEDEAQLSSITVINLDTWTKISRTRGPCAHIAENWITQWKTVPN